MTFSFCIVCQVLKCMYCVYCVERGLYFGLDATNVPLLSPSFKLHVTLYTPQSKQLLTVKINMNFFYKNISCCGCKSPTGYCKIHKLQLRRRENVKLLILLLTYSLIRYVITHPSHYIFSHQICDNSSFSSHVLITHPYPHIFSHYICDNLSFSLHIL